eukprot:15504693-Heterocapsa_arctica.AAC.1
MNYINIAQPLRLHATKSDDEQINLKEYMDYMKKGKHDIEQINPKEYMDYMKKGQYDIYYIAGENIDRASHYMEKGTDPIDEHRVQ